MWERMKIKEHLEDRGKDRKLTLKWILEKENKWEKLDSISSRYGKAYVTTVTDIRIS